MVLHKPDVLVETFQVLNISLQNCKGRLYVYMVQRRDIGNTKILAIQ